VGKCAKGEVALCSRRRHAENLVNSLNVISGKWVTSNR
jgi:hypothetical protein